MKKGRQYVCIYYSWGHIRYNYVSFSHARIGPGSELPEGELEQLDGKLNLLISLTLTLLSILSL